MDNIIIPREKIIELIKKDTCSFYDYENYCNLEVNLISNYHTELKQFENSNVLGISYKDLATLLLDKIVKVDDTLFITVS